MVMAEVTAALLTFSDAAICGSDGSRMLVASVPVAARPASTAICTKVEEASGRGAASIAMVWSAMDGSRFLELNYVYHIKRVREPRNGGVFLNLEGNIRISRHCEPTGRAKRRPMTGSAKQSIPQWKKEWIASVFARCRFHPP